MSRSIILGTWQLSDGHRNRPRPREALLDDFVAFADAGVRTFDCADIYTGVESFLGDFLRTYRDRRGAEAASSIRINTKYVPDLDRLRTLTRADAEAVIDRSLARLGVDRLDMVQFAWWDYGIDRYVEVAGWLQELRRAGKIARLGATNFDAPHLAELLDAGIPIEAHQVQYSVLDRRPAGAMTDLCSGRDIELLCYGGLAGGLLSDQYLGIPESNLQLANRSLVKYRLIVEELGRWDAFQTLLGGLREVADEVDSTIAQVAIAYTLSRPRVGAVIVGASRPERIEEALDAARLDLPEQAIQRLYDLVSGASGPAGPVFGLERDREGPHGRIMKYDLNE